MSETTPISQPLLIVVAGRPGAGKTSLAHALARAVRCPAICRDEIKEGFVNTIGRKGQPGDDAERGVYETFFDTVTLLLNRRVTLVAEAAFQHKLWAPKLEPLREIARVRIVVCTVDPVLAHSRHVERGLADPARERFHHDRAMHADREGRELPIGEYDPPRLDVPTLLVDTSDGYRPDFDEIVAFARG
jgi:predicted kinase